jgi:hypothetical protein
MGHLLLAHFSIRQQIVSLIRNDINEYFFLIILSRDGQSKAIYALNLIDCIQSPLKGS